MEYWNNILWWVLFNWLIAPVGYSVAVGDFFRQCRGMLLGALIGVATMIVSISMAMVVVELSQNPRYFLGIELYPNPMNRSLFIQSQVTAIAGAAVTGWASRYIPGHSGWLES